jgi:hypothetical protein
MGNLIYIFCTLLCHYENIWWRSDRKDIELRNYKFITHYMIVDVYDWSNININECIVIIYFEWVGFDHSILHKCGVYSKSFDITLLQNSSIF